MAAMRLYENGHARANDLEMVHGLWGNRLRKGARSERRLCDGQILVWGDGVGAGDFPVAL